MGLCMPMTSNPSSSAFFAKKQPSCPFIPVIKNLALILIP